MFVSILNQSVNMFKHFLNKMQTKDLLFLSRPIREVLILSVMSVRTSVGGVASKRCIERIFNFKR
jgi:hypothetical protein